MLLHHIALPLPPSIRVQLASLCYGIPHMQWIEEESFYLIIRSLGILSDQIAAQIRERLASLFFLQFSIHLKGIGCHPKGNRGSLWVGVGDTTELIALRKEIDQHLRDLHLRAEEHSFHPHVTIGRYDHLNGQKLGDYLASHADFESIPFDITSCQLITSHQTPKHHYFEVEQQINASTLATGDD